MKDYLVKDPWRIIEDSFHKEHNEVTESIFSIGNGYMGQRANFCGPYSGKTLQGSYLAGIYYPDKTRVGWWKNGYPEYFAKVINSVNWIGINLYIGDELIDFNLIEVLDFKRTLDMHNGVLELSVTFKNKDGRTFQLNTERICHGVIKELGCIKYEISSVDYNGPMRICSYLDFDVQNRDSNYEEKFWTRIGEGNDFVSASTRKTDFEVYCQVSNVLTGVENISSDYSSKHLYNQREYSFEISEGTTVKLFKYAAITSTFYLPKNELTVQAEAILQSACDKCYDVLKKEHTDHWNAIWDNSDITIDGDIGAQQGIRFNIFHLNQTYSGEDARLNIGPKGFTGEKYGGVTYWDTEAYCIPFYLCNAGPEVGEKLLKYRYNHLERAIENAGKLGFDKGAALYPMVTMNGEECHNEWEITFEEIHRNGAIAYAIYDYIHYTGDYGYLKEGGLEVLIGIARFWSQRVNWSNKKEKYVMLGVTGPNEYENNVNNNWYTNYIAVWCMKYCISCIGKVKEKYSTDYERIVADTSLLVEEMDKWSEISNKMYLPYDEEQGIYLQQDNFLDKEIIPVSELDESHRPINQNWSWDRILRSCYIKQADTLQGMYFFEDDFDKEVIRKHFDFYEPLTVHESSLSPCVHAILASKLGYKEKAYEMYVRTARLDLDDYNNDTEDGLHITSMAGTWMAVVKGFGGMRYVDGQLHLDPFLPEEWSSYAFKIWFNDNRVEVQVLSDKVVLHNKNDRDMDLTIFGQLINLKGLSQKDIFYN